MASFYLTPYIHCIYLCFWESNHTYCLSLIGSLVDLFNQSNEHHLLLDFQLYEEFNQINQFKQCDQFHQADDFSGY